MPSTASLHDVPTVLPAVTAAEHARPMTFLDLYDAHFDFVWRVARRMGVGADDLDDFVQEVFMVVHRRLAEFEGKSSLRTWLFAIVFRSVQGHRRTRQRRREVILPDPEPAPPDDASPLDLAERAQKVRLLHALLEELDDDKRAAFVLSELEQMTAPEIAEATGVNLNTVYARVRAARREFQIALTRHTEASRRRTP